MSCSCGSNCSSGKRYPDWDEKINNTQTTVIVGFAPAKSEFGGAEMAEAAAENECKCGSSCSCTNLPFIISSCTCIIT